MPKKKKWNGTWPYFCDFCKTDLALSKRFVDGRTQIGPWALMCPPCHSKKGTGLGVGCGQSYDSKTLEKIEG